MIINGKMDAANYSAYSGYAHLGAGSAGQIFRVRVQAYRLGLVAGGLAVQFCPVGLQTWGSAFGSLVLLVLGV